MDDNLGPFGLSLGCKVIYSRIDPVIGLTHSWHGPLCQECGKARLASEHRRRTGDMGDRLRAEWVIEGLQGLLLQVEISEIVVHEADEPDPLVDFLP